jgi:hypothetical protein
MLGFVQEKNSHLGVKCCESYCAAKIMLNALNNEFSSFRREAIETAELAPISVVSANWSSISTAPIQSALDADAPLVSQFNDAAVTQVQHGFSGVLLPTTALFSRKKLWL